MQIRHICIQDRLRKPSYNYIKIKTRGLFGGRIIIDDPFWGLYLYLPTEGHGWALHFLDVTKENVISLLTSENEVFRDFAAKWMEKYYS